MEKVQLNVRVSADARDSMEAICTANKCTQAEAVEAALRAYRTPADRNENGAVALVQRVETLARALSALQERLDTQLPRLEQAARLILQFFAVRDIQ
jgi:hypothetical protein